MLPESLEFFLDENNSIAEIAAVISATGAIAHLHREHFPVGLADVGWLPEVGKKGWILITRDRRIRYRASELAAFRNANLRIFLVTAHGLSAQQEADFIADALPKMFAFIKKNSAPFIAKIFRGGRVEKWV